jgi:hypothetical protein
MLSEKEIKDWSESTKKQNVPIMPCGHRWFTKGCKICRQIERWCKNE